MLSRCTNLYPSKSAKPIPSNVVLAINKPLHNIRRRINILYSFTEKEGYVNTTAVTSDIITNSRIPQPPMVVLFTTLMRLTLERKFFLKYVTLINVFYAG